jgi:Lipocalin-like domain
MASTTITLRDQLVGAWDLKEYYAYLPSNHSDKYYPMGETPAGIVMYTPDGYMSAQLLVPGQKPFKEGTEADWATVGKSYIAYTGAFYLDEKGDEKGPILNHQMRTSNLPQLLGDTQRRLMKITDEADGKYLTLAPAGPMKVAPDGLDRILVVRWKRCPDNQSTKAPSKGGDTLPISSR